MTNGAGQQAPLGDRILAELRRKPAQKAGELAKALGGDRQEVNRCLSYELAGKVKQDQGYRWSLVGQRSAPPAQTDRALETEFSKLVRYYLECIAEDSDQGVSVLAANRDGEPAYAELPAVPISGQAESWWSAPGVSRILGKVAAERGRVVAYVGYPVRLRKHRAGSREGFLVEPVMLWPVAMPKTPGDPYALADDLPALNFAFLRSLAMGDPVQVVDEAARLTTDLGLANPVDDQPEVDELLQRLRQVRGDWDWVEPLDPAACSTGVSLAALQQAGIYNRAVVLVGERSPYTQGLETELKALADKSGTELAGSALGAWLSGRFEEAGEADQAPLLEVLPMNGEQRQAIRSALTRPLTVITGPPGTGKSQVVTNLLVNTIWLGKKVLFASKNNKAVDVVESRVNGLGNRPVLLRVGSKEYQAKLSDYLTAMLSGAVRDDDEKSYQEGRERHEQLIKQSLTLEDMQAATLRARNTADQLDAAVTTHRALFKELFSKLRTQQLEQGQAALPAYWDAIESIDQSRMGAFGRLAFRLTREMRYSRLRKAQQDLTATADHVGTALPDSSGQPDFKACLQAVGELERRVKAGLEVQKYLEAIDVLRACPAFEDIAKQRADLNEQVSRNSATLWRAYVQLTPRRLGAEQRKKINDYAALLRLINAPEGQGSGDSRVREQAKKLQKETTLLFSCWAVTSLSARGKIPLEAGHFDLVVIDEASQCDIASALPLLYRAKSAVIIGDPQQLRHISAVTRQRELQLQEKYDIVGSRASWMYSVNSLYDLAASLAQPEETISLRDHHRSHADIIQFSNEEFYDGHLRVATRYATLRRPRDSEPGVMWTDVRGQVERPGSGGARNDAEAAAVIAFLRDLLVTRGFDGTVGVVTPFRAQAQRIQEFCNRASDLAQAAIRAELLIDTVHKFQGDERDVMVFSPVVSAGISQGALGFLRANDNLFNVAITRARGLLQVVGDLAAARTCGIDYLESFAAYVGGLEQERAERQAEPLPGDLGPTYPTVARPENVSEWEHALYRAMHKAGLRPIPQFSVEQYDLDFALIVGERRLDIEVDGERYHRSWTGELCVRDQLRNQRLIELGWEVKRFWVYEIRDRQNECVRWVQDWAAKASAT